MSSLLKNAELARYHEDTSALKSNYRSGLNTVRNSSLQPVENSIIPEQEKPEPRTLLMSELKKPIDDGSRTERLGNPTSDQRQSKTVNEMLDLLKFNKELDRRVVGSLK